MSEDVLFKLDFLNDILNYNPDQSVDMHSSFVPILSLSEYDYNQRGLRMKLWVL